MSQEAAEGTTRATDDEGKDAAGAAAVPDAPAEDAP
ncbi:hypothetical protein SZN_32826, partial [Streptomyces zinciresistens K42]